MDPEFLPSSEHIAHCPVTNPTAKQWTYDAELYLVKDSTKYTSSGIVSFTLAAGASGTVDFPITMPGSEGTYDVYLDIYVAGERIAAYQATEPVVVLSVPPEASVVFTLIDADTGYPLPGVTGVMAGITRITDSSGQCEFTGIIEGDYPISFVKEGYETYEDTVSFHPPPVPTPVPPNNDDGHVGQPL